MQDLRGKRDRKRIIIGKCLLQKINKTKSKLLGSDRENSIYQNVTKISFW